MLLAPYYREYELPWEGDEESNERFRKILRVLLIILALFGAGFALHVLWWVAIAALVIALIGFFLRR